MYATIQDPQGRYWTGAAFETCVTANWATYDVPLTEVDAGCYLYAVDIPAAISTPGDYVVNIFLQAGGTAAITDLLKSSGVFLLKASQTVASRGSIEVDVDAVLVDTTLIVADTNELQQQFDDVDSTGTEVITAAKALEIMLAILGGDANYNTTTRIFTVLGRDGTTELLTVTIDALVAGDRTASTLP